MALTLSLEHAKTTLALSSELQVHLISTLTAKTKSMKAE